MQVLLVLLSIPIMILNVAGGIGGGIWLAILSQWYLVGYGLVGIICSSFLLGLALLPGMAFIVPASLAAERNRFLTAGCLAALGNIWTYGVLTAWCVGSFLLIIAEHKSGSLWPYLLWSYAVATGPWTFMASRESQADPNSFSSTTAFAASVGAITMMVATYVKGRAEISLLVEVFLIPIIICFIFQISLFIIAAKSQKARAKLEAMSAAKHVEILQPQLDDQRNNEAINSAEQPINDPQLMLPNRAQESMWFVLVNGKELGPVKFSDLEKLVNRGALQKDIQLRRDDAKGWINAGEVSGLFEPEIKSNTASPLAGLSLSKADRFSHEPENIAVRSGETSTEIIGATQHRWNNYIARHWRGELSLPLSYWINGFLGNVVAAVAVAIISASADIKDAFRPEIALLSIVLIWATALVIFLWQMVGVWRSATNYQRVKSNRYWGGIAKFFVIIAFLQTIGSVFRTGAPQIIEYYKIYAGDEEVGKYAFRVLRDGRELEFSGGITFGAAKEFERFIDAMGAIKLVHLDSLGGRIEEAQRIGDIIKNRGLSTYAPARCMSACTIIFLSGRDRFISRNSKIGFHQPNFPGITDETRRSAIAVEERRLRGLGVSAAFARRANLAPPNDMWFPTAPELLSNGVATNLVDSADFAMSGLGRGDLAEASIKKAFEDNDLFQAIKLNDPESSAKIIEIIENGVRRGRSITDLRADILPLIASVFNKALPYTSDDYLLSFGKFAIKISYAYNKDDPAACYYYANPNAATSDILIRFADKYKELAEEELKLETNIIRNYSGKNVVIPDEQSVSGSLKSVILSLQNNKIDLSVFDNKTITPDKYSQYCAGLIALYEETLRLPKREAAALMRYFVASQ